MGLDVTGQLSEQHLKTCLVLVAMQLGVVDPEFMDSKALTHSIANLSPCVSAAYNIFAARERDWQAFHQSVHKTGTAGALSPEQSARQVETVQVMEAARSKLIAAIAAHKRTSGS